MRRSLLTAVALGFFSTMTFVGCGEEAKVEQKETVSGPDGTTTTTVDKKVESTGSNPPANSAGETVKP